MYVYGKLKLWEGTEMDEEYKEMIKKAIEYIENHLHEELTTERVVAVSMYHFHRIFQSYIGMSVTDLAESFYETLLEELANLQFEEVEK